MNFWRLNLRIHDDYTWRVNDTVYTVLLKLRKLWKALKRVKLSNCMMKMNLWRIVKKKKKNAEKLYQKYFT